LLAANIISISYSPVMAALFGIVSRQLNKFKPALILFLEHLKRSLSFFSQLTAIDSLAA
jgi:hypothetical protein